MSSYYLQLRASIGTSDLELLPEATDLVLARCRVLDQLWLTLSALILIRMLYATALLNSCFGSVRVQARGFPKLGTSKGPVLGNPVISKSSISSAASKAFGSSKRGTIIAATASMVSPIIVKPSAQHTSTVIMLHGLGDTGNGWTPVGQMFAADMPNTKFVFPTAPSRPITVNMGMSMPGWHDIVSLEKLDAEEDRSALLDSMQTIEALAKSEQDNGIQKIVIAGFSQGGTIALLMLRSKLKFAGIVGLSTYLSLRDDPLLSDSNRETPVLMAHGTADQVVKYKFGEMSNQILTQAGAKIEFKSFAGMGHEARPEELDSVRDFLKSVLHDA